LKGRNIKLETAVKKGQNPHENKDANSTVDGSESKVKAKKAPPAQTHVSTEDVKEDTVDGVDATVSNDISTSHTRLSMQLVVLGLPSYVNKKIFTHALQKIHRKPGVTVDLLKEVVYMCSMLCL
jgi:hypothetical protein